MCSNKRLRESDDNDSKTNSTRVTCYEVQRQLRRKNILKVLHAMYLNKICWYKLLENESASPLQQLLSAMASCKGSCPFYFSRGKDCAELVSRLGFSNLSARTFISASGVDLSRLNLVTFYIVFDLHTN